MSESLDAALLSLERLVASCPGGEVPALDGAISDVMKFNDPNCIGPLLYLLRDESLYDEGVFSLIHSAESFDDQTYICKFLSMVLALVKMAPAWASVLVMRIINNESARRCLIAELRGASVDVKSAVVWLFEGINNEDPSFVAKTMAPLLAARS